MMEMHHFKQELTETCRRTTKQRPTLSCPIKKTQVYYANRPYRTIQGIYSSELT